MWCIWLQWFVLLALGRSEWVRLSLLSYWVKGRFIIFFCPSRHDTQVCRPSSMMSGWKWAKGSVNGEERVMLSWDLRPTPPSGASSQNALSITAGRCEQLCLHYVFPWSRKGGLRFCKGHWHDEESMSLQHRKRFKCITEVMFIQSALSHRP